MEILIVIGAVNMLVFVNNSYRIPAVLQRHCCCTPCTHVKFAVLYLPKDCIPIENGVTIHWVYSKGVESQRRKATREMQCLHTSHQNYEHYKEDAQQHNYYCLFSLELNETLHSWMEFKWLSWYTWMWQLSWLFHGAWNDIYIAIASLAMGCLSTPIFHLC